MQKNEYEYLIYIGRFQPSHLAHIETIKTALMHSKNVIVLIGSSFQPRTIKNPWTWQERADMLGQSLTVEERSRVIFAPIADDAYNNQRWVTQVQKVVDKCSDGSDNVGMIGHTKDDTSFYLKMFPQWKHIEMPNIDDLHATDIREALFTLLRHEFSKEYLSKLPKEIHDYLMAWTYKPEASALQIEYEFIDRYKSAYKDAPYAPIFVTVDAVVVQSGHVLLIRRRSAPGKNLWALPGGFLNSTESIEVGMIRELREETKIKVPDPVLRGNIKKNKVYDAVNRSLRGRTITHVFCIELPPGKLPHIKGADDAYRADWIPISTVYAMQDQMFEDHFHIIQDLIGT